MMMFVLALVVSRSAAWVQPTRPDVRSAREAQKVGSSLETPYLEKLDMSPRSLAYMAEVPDEEPKRLFRAPEYVSTLVGRKSGQGPSSDYLSSLGSKRKLFNVLRWWKKRGEVDYGISAATPTRRKRRPEPVAPVVESVVLEPATPVAVAPEPSAPDVKPPPPPSSFDYLSTIASTQQHKQSTGGVGPADYLSSITANARPSEADYAFFDVTAKAEAPAPEEPAREDPPVAVPAPRQQPEKKPLLASLAAFASSLPRFGKKAPVLVVDYSFTNDFTSENVRIVREPSFLTKLLSAIPLVKVFVPKPATR
mmetsp:Transcript_5378/g.16302  ORF Transcript_5378/g.16302 Transcript_5378/m.16302 type:complete len:309 (+) Transcript_5378:47-973(+)